MTRLDPSAPVGALFDVLRRRLPAAGAERSSADAGQDQVRVGSLPVLRERLAQLLAGVDPNDRKAIAMIAPAVLREVLAEQLGGGVLDLAEAPHLLARLQGELQREVYHGLWRELITQVRGQVLY
jgi:hypothetical protein